MTRQRTHRGRRSIIGTLAVVSLGLAACGGDDDADDADEPASAEQNDNTSAGSGDASTVDEPAAEPDDSDGDPAATTGVDFPIAIPDGVLLDALADSGIVSPGQRQLFYPNDDVDRLVAFFDDWTSQNGEWARGEAQGTTTWLRIDGEGMQSISITPDHDPGAQADGPVTFVLLVTG